MAETKAGKERVYVHGHYRDGKWIAPQYRTPPCPNTKPKKG